MLVLSRKLNESIYIGPDIVVTVMDVDRGKVRLGVAAPRATTILRGELLPEPARLDVPNPPEYGSPVG